MIAADSSSLVAYFNGDDGEDVRTVRRAISSAHLVLPPAVFAELLSDRRAVAIEEALVTLPLLDIRDGYWLRAGRARRLLRENGLKAKVADALIAQSCIDHDVPLITRDRDFRHFEKHCGLKLA